MEASEELSEIASTYAATMIAATAAFVRGMVFLTAGELEAAIAGLNDARARWSEFGAPYEVARVQALLGDAYRALGDYDSADLETAAARATFEALGARPDLAQLAGAIEKDDLLTDRESQVLELVARGKTNMAIAQELFVSNRTVERHLSNIFTKLGVSTRTAAAAYAFERNATSRFDL